MKHLAKLILLFLLPLFVTNCKKSDTTTTTTTIVKPHYFFNGGNGISVADTRDISNVKFYFFTWNSTTNKYEYTATTDTTSLKALKNWPSTVTDPVGIGYTYHFLNRVNGKSTYQYNGTGFDLDSLNADVPDLSASWISPFKIDGYANMYEQRGVTSGPSYFYFDLDAGTYTLLHDGTVTLDESIKSLILTPKGSLTSSSVDFSKADAVAYDYDETSVSAHKNNLYFIDYDAMKYLQISRKDNVADETNRNTLVTPDWTPLSNLITGWKF